MLSIDGGGIRTKKVDEGSSASAKKRYIEKADKTVTAKSKKDSATVVNRNQNT